jgi:hypothetical protein
MSDTAQATPYDILQQRIMDPNIAKTEPEWWAARRIAELEAKLAKVRELPGEWRDNPDHYDWLCADELEALLK